MEQTKYCRQVMVKYPFCTIARENFQLKHKSSICLGLIWAVAQIGPHLLQTENKSTATILIMLTELYVLKS